MARRRRNASAVNAWPGYVDALSSLLMVVTFVLLVFVLGQQFLSATINQREHTLDSLRAELGRLSDMLSLSEAKVKALGSSEQQQRAMIASLSSQLDAKRRQITDLEGHAHVVEGTQLANIATLSSQMTELTRQLHAIADALELERKSNGEKDVRIAELGQKLNLALANKVNQLQKYRSEFFGRLREILKDQPGIEIVGDRFVFQTSILFSSGSASLTPEGRQEIIRMAHTLHEVAASIPEDMPWILRVDGHADHRPVHANFPSNWELSSARAITVVKTLILNGVDPHHIAATSFSGYQPLEKGDSPEALAHNRRIEFRLTDR